MIIKAQIFGVKDKVTINIESTNVEINIESTNVESTK